MKIFSRVEVQNDSNIQWLNLMKSQPYSSHALRTMHERNITVVKMLIDRNRTICFDQSRACILYSERRLHVLKLL